MNKSEAGKIGAAVTKERCGLKYCPYCGALMLNDFYQKNGHKGGLKGGKTTRDRYGFEHFSEIGKKGGRPRRKAVF